MFRIKLGTLPYLGPAVHFVVQDTVVAVLDTVADSCNTDCNLVGVADCIRSIG